MTSDCLRAIAKSVVVYVCCALKCNMLAEKRSVLFRWMRSFWKDSGTMMHNSRIHYRVTVFTSLMLPRHVLHLILFLLSAYAFCVAEEFVSLITPYPSPCLRLTVINCRAIQTLMLAKKATCNEKRGRWVGASWHLMYKVSNILIIFLQKDSNFKGAAHMQNFYNSGK